MPRAAGAAGTPPEPGCHCRPRPPALGHAPLRCTAQRPARLIQPRYQRWTRAWAPLQATAQERCIPEDDPRYRRSWAHPARRLVLPFRQPAVSLTAPTGHRVDMSELHAWDARHRFTTNISRGEAEINLADAALQIAAEDDALVSHSSVPLPVPAFLARIKKFADELTRLRLPPACGGEPAQVLKVHPSVCMQSLGMEVVRYLIGRA